MVRLSHSEYHTRKKMGITKKPRSIRLYKSKGYSRDTWRDRKHLAFMVLCFKTIIFWTGYDNYYLHNGSALACFCEAVFQLHTKNEGEAQPGAWCIIRPRHLTRLCDVKIAIEEHWEELFLSECPSLLSHLFFKNIWTKLEHHAF